MSKKYRKLSEHLAGLDEGRWEADFVDVEQVLGVPLPASARTYQAWWANQMRSQSLGWQLAGWKAVDLDLKNEKVTFVYVGSDDGEDDRLLGGGDAPRLTITEAKAGLAATFGVDPRQIEITITG